MEEDKMLYQTGAVSKTIFDRTLKYLNSKYSLRFNTISLEFEIKRSLDKKWSSLNLSSLYIELIQSGIDIPVNKLEILVRSHLIDQYNPISEYFESLKEWDGEDHIKNFCSYVKTNDDNAFLYHMEKWFTRSVLCALEKEKINKHCLVLANTIQNSGKSTYLRFFVPRKLMNYLSEDIGLDKDSRIKLCKNLIINLDELSILARADINSLKAFISKTHINERLPYARKAEYLERICSFVGSTNKTDFLTDESGSVRWIIFEVTEKINFNYSLEIDIDKVWAQAYFNAYKRKGFNPELTLSDISENERRNERFTQMTLEQEMINKFYEPSDNLEEFKTATEVMMDLSTQGIRLNHLKIGRALSSFKFPRVKHPQRQIYGYLIQLKTTD
ncbi:MULTISPECIES: VapE domain-containing protein [unclassified Kaistella]|uniref:VapE domain-containing protein n=1 Tax=unclassified Kaistella TaxID=2762626 RepID=UPI0027367250|nr:MULTISPECIES: VapE domain-containing protein [unclassified Kaistella]MDP2455107.1 VapE family protein [Kaistella sp. SH11-4b]MDP2458014.1 VapE family protein [Kaistella sp. SH40-3]MDP2460981.1 VapE family protein [Kaistella sp. SH19-2b]